MTCCLPRLRIQLALAGAGLLLASALSPSGTGLLYQTNFEAFCVGPDQWVGHEQWVGNSIGAAVHGIDEDIAAGFGQTAFLGVTQPNSPLVSVSRPLNLLPHSRNTAAIEIDTIIGFEHSQNGHRDNFFLSLYNDDGDYLASVQFSHEPGETFSIWRDDGSLIHDTGFDVGTGELIRYILTVDLAANTWSGVIYLGGQPAPLFTNQPFSTLTDSPDIGSVAYEWLLTSEVTNEEGDYIEHGDNWMLVADLFAWAIPEGTPEVETQAPGMTPDGQAVLGFSGEPGWTYQVEYTDSLKNWQSNLPNSTFTVDGTTKQPLTFTDPSPIPPPNRFFRIQRTITP